MGTVPLLNVSKLDQMDTTMPVTPLMEASEISSLGSVDRLVRPLHGSNVTEMIVVPATTIHLAMAVPLLLGLLAELLVGVVVRDTVTASRLEDIMLPLAPPEVPLHGNNKAPLRQAGNRITVAMALTQVQDTAIQTRPSLLSKAWVLHLDSAVALQEDLVHHQD